MLLALLLACSGAADVATPTPSPFDGSWLATIARDRPTLTVLVPATIQAVSDHPAWAETDLSSLRAVSTGSTIVPPHLVDRFVARGVPVLQVYGSTETCPVAPETTGTGNSPPARKLASWLL